MNAVFREFRSADVLTPQLVVSMFRHLRDELAKENFPKSSLDGLHEYYDEQFKTLPYFLHHFAPFVAQVENRLKPQTNNVKVLDLGCGTGIQAFLLAARGADVIGIDMNSMRVRAGQAARAWFEQQFECQLKVNLIEGNAFEILPDYDATFDAVYTQFALAYMKPQDEMLKCIDKSSKVNAEFILQEFNSAGLYNRLIAKKDWFSFRQYRQLEQLGWTCDTERFQWIFPKAVMKTEPLCRVLGGIEDAFCKLPGAHHIASSVNLVYRKRK